MQQRQVRRMRPLNVARKPYTFTHAAGLGIRAVPTMRTRCTEAVGRVVRLRIDSPQACWPVTLPYPTVHADDLRVRVIRPALGRE